MKKIAVYAICKNEMKFLPTWWENMSKGVDYVCILDTGSTDGSVEWLEAKSREDQCLIYDSKVITPWAFDVARNESMALVPQDADILVCTDLDEKWLTPNWASVLKKAWKKGTVQATYRFDWRMDEDGVTPLSSFRNCKIHKRNDFVWKYPIHEDIHYIGSEVFDHDPTVDLYDKLVLQHFPDSKKPRDYTPMIELRVERFKDTCSRMYLGIAYGETDDEDLWEKAVEQFTEVVEHPDETLRNERERSYCANKIGFLYYKSDCHDMALKWFKRAYEIDPHYRDAVLDLARYYLNSGMHGLAYRYALEALNNCDRMNIWIENDKNWDTIIPLIIASSCAYNVRKFDEALMYARQALEQDPNSEDAKKLIAKIEAVTKQSK